MRQLLPQITCKAVLVNVTAAIIVATCILCLQLFALRSFPQNTLEKKTIAVVRLLANVH